MKQTFVQIFKFGFVLVAGLVVGFKILGNIDFYFEIQNIVDISAHARFESGIGIEAHIL
jgi:hypothetical protein